MKKLSILLLAFVAFSGIYSCSSDDDVVFIAQPDVEGISFTNSFNASYILTPGTATNVAERFVWNTVDFEVPTNITYELQGSTDTDFTNFDVMGTTGDNNLAVTVQQMMNLAKDAGLDADPETDASNSGPLYFRVIAYAGDNAGNSNAQNSEVKSITVLLPEDAEEE
ncbi:MAG: SusE domain-containing protein, partial [Bacteroidota bacterium]